ncbi:hypothetical protein AAG570_012060 [Ranatra chinensis]|uniref:Mitochondrial GTPase 1 n=1 Tax=Ranatra chinensis TaxID=642074 RepID=A0ABD0YJS9_9HEMI
MGKGLKQMQQKLRSVDCVIEVHDARIPYSGRNPNFKNTVTGLKPHILVLNKMELITKSNRYNRTELQDYCIMIIGVPNVGKSSLINALRNKYLKKSNVAPVGAIAGITKSVMSKIKICENPLIYVLDTPGILSPSVSDVETGLKLALCSSMQDHLVGPTVIADYLLYWLNKHHNFSYVKFLSLEEPSDNITEVLMLSAIKLKKIIKKKDVEGHYSLMPDLEFAANHFIKGFRKGELGKVILDKITEDSSQPIIQSWTFNVNG